MDLIKRYLTSLFTRTSSYNPRNIHSILFLSVHYDRPQARNTCYSSI